MTEQLIEETIELGEVDEADLAKLYAGGDGEGGEEEGGEPEYHTIMEVWQRLLTDGIASEADDKPGLVWTGRMLASYQGLEWYDGYAIRDAYFTKLQQALDVVNLEISYEPSALTVISAADDAAANAEHYKNILLHWQLLFIAWEQEWDCEDEWAGAEVAAIGEAHKLLLGEMGMAQHLERIPLAFTDDDQATFSELFAELNLKQVTGE